MEVSTGTPQLSVAVGVVHEGTAVHSLVEGAGSGVMTGGVVSVTLIVWDAVAVLPHGSVAVQVLVIVKASGQDPLVVTSIEVNMGTPQPSVTVGVVHTGATEH